MAAARSGSGRTGRGAAHDAASRRGGCGARRPARLRDVFERTGGERARGRGVSLDRSTVRCRSMRVRLTRHCRRTSSTIAVTCGPSPHATVSRGSSGRSWSEAGLNARRRSRGPLGPPDDVGRSRTHMALRTRVWGAGKLVLLGVALLATYVLFAAASMRLALRVARGAGAGRDQSNGHRCDRDAGSRGTQSPVRHGAPRRSEDRGRARCRAGARRRRDAAQPALPSKCG